MTAPNWKNRTMWTGDNLDVMRGLNSETVDLIYLDPPFNSNRDYAAPIGSKAAAAAFKDTWTLSDVDEAWHGEIAESQPALYSGERAKRFGELLRGGVPRLGPSLQRVSRPGCPALAPPPETAMRRRVGRLPGGCGRRRYPPMTPRRVRTWPPDGIG